MTRSRTLTAIAVPFVAAACWALPALAEPGAMGEPKMLIYGNYCGPGNNAPLPPIDALDAACARHDACTPYGHMTSRACDLRLQQEAAVISQDPRTPDDERAMAGFISAGASVMTLISPPDQVAGR